MPGLTEKDWNTLVIAVEWPVPWSRASNSVAIAAAPSLTVHDIPEENSRPPTLIRITVFAADWMILTSEALAAAASWRTLSSLVSAESAPPSPRTALRADPYSSCSSSIEMMRMLASVAGGAMLFRTNPSTAFVNTER